MKRHYSVSVTFCRAQGTRLTVALLSLFIVHGCAFKFDNTYPEDWPAPLPTELGKCPNISGTYHNQHCDAVEREEEYQLYPSMTGKILETDTCANCPVELAWQDSKRSILRVTLFDESLPLPQTVTLESSKKHFYCSDGSLYVPYRDGRWFIASGSFVKGELRFFPARDGSLIAENYGRGAGYMWFFPFTVEGNRHVRWRRVSPKL